MNKYEEIRRIQNEQKKLISKIKLSKYAIIGLATLALILISAGGIAFLITTLNEFPLIASLGVIGATGAVGYGSYKGIDSVFENTVKKYENQLVDKNKEINALKASQSGVSRARRVELTFPPTQRKNETGSQEVTPKYNYDRSLANVNVAEAGNYGMTDNPYVPDVPDFLARGSR